MPERDVPRTGLLSPPWRLLMQIGGDRQTTVGMEIADSIVIGRSDPQIDFHPELDLTPYGGQESGVSRRHVMITKGGKALYIKDLGSTNGTRINGFQLEADQLYRLRDGDELELGRVHITVRFVRSPY
jgi:pSer/pThr/pTyr-binding forkhead associated (FHA) protein